MSTKNTNTLTVAELLYQRANEGREIVLPASGFPVKVKPVELQTLIRNKLVPQSLYAIALGGFRELERLESSESPEDMDKFAEMSIQVDNYIYQTLRHALVEPRIVEGTPDLKKNEISFDVLPEEDKQFLMQLLQLPVKNWETFLSKQDTSVSSVANIEVVQRKAE
jgi:hypothetical protein